MNMGRPKKEPKEFKTCKKCRKRKSSIEYYSTSSQCKTCHTKTVKRNQKRKKKHYNNYRQQYALQHPDKVAIWKKQAIDNWEQRNGKKYKDHALEKHNQRKESDPSYQKHLSKRAKRYREINKGKIAEKQKQYYLKNCETLRKKALERYHKNKDQYSVTRKIYKAKKNIQNAIEKNNSGKIKSQITKLNDLYQQQAIIKTHQKSI